MKDFFGISFWFGEEYRYWYIHLIILLYFISPLYFNLNKRRRVLVLVAASLFPFLLQIVAADIFNNIEIAVCRIPIYLLGFLMADGMRKGKILTVKEWWLLILSMIVFQLLRVLGNQVISRYAQSLWAIVICVFFCSIAEKLKIGKIKWLEFIGEISLEMYIIQVSLIWISVNVWDINLTKLSIYLLIMLATFLTSIMVHEISLWINKKLMIKI